MNATERSSAKSEAVEMLRKFLKPGATVYTVLRSVARSGMSRVIDLYTFDGERKVYLTGYASKALSMTRTDDGIRVNGCGSDAGFDTVYSLGRCLWPKGFPCCGESPRCQSNDHSNGDRDYTRGTQVYSDEVIARDNLSGAVAFTHWHRDGGYALRHEWI